MASIPLTNLTLLRRAFVDVIRGYSIGTYLDKPLYIRHLGHHDHLDLDNLRIRLQNECKAKGGLTEEERLTQLKSQNLWADHKEVEIERQRLFVRQLIDGKKVVVLPSVMRSQEKQIDDETAKLMVMLRARAEAVGMTVEIYAQRLMDDYYILHNLFKDKDLITPILSDDQFEDLGEDDIQSIYKVYQSASDPCTDTNLRKLAVQSFFTDYYGLCLGNMSDFFGKSVCQMTFYQVRLGNIARYFSSIMENTDMGKLSPVEQGDPEAIERLYITQKNMSKEQSEGRTPVAMTQSDLRDTGMDAQMTKLPKSNMGGAELIKHLQSQRQSRG